MYGILRLVQTHSAAAHIEEQVVLPNQVAAEEQAEDEDENGRPKDNNVDIEGKVLKPYIRHPESVML